MHARLGVRWREVLLASGLLVLGVVVGAGAAFLTYLLNYDRIHHGVQVGGIPLGGLTVPEARERLQMRLNEIAQQPVLLRADDWEMAVIPVKAGLKYNVEAMVAEAYAVGRVGYPWDRWREILRTVRQGYEVQPQLAVDAARLHHFLNDLAARTDRPPQSASWHITPRGQVTVVPGKKGRRLNVDALFRHLKVAMWPGKSRQVRLQLEEVVPSLTTEEAVALKIEEQLARFRTSFDPTNTNRVENIRLAAMALDMYLLRPGEIFSFNAAVGPRIPESGYTEAPVVVRGKLVPGIGGGVCQVSSTLYNAVLRANLPVVERHPHSLPSPYVAPGVDATVSYGYLDFKFANDRPGGILIHSVVGEGWVEVSLYGKKVGKEEVRIEPEIMETFPPKIKKKKDPALPAGQEELEEKGYPGYRVRVWRIFSANGQEIRREVISEDLYAPLDTVIRVGTAPG